MGRGRGRRRRHRRNGINIYPYFTLPYYYDRDYPIYEPLYLDTVIFPRINHVTARRESVKTFYPEITDANGVIGMMGSGFEGIPGGRLRITFTIGTSRPREKDAAIIEQSPTKMLIAIPVDGDLLDEFQLLDIAYYRDGGELVSLGDQFFSAASYPFSPFNNMNHGKRFSAVRPDNPQLVYQTGYGAHAAAHSPTIPGGLPPNRMTETTRMMLHSRMLPEGVRYGVPGIPFPQPGWAGQAGIAQSPHPTRRAAAPVDRTFGPGLSAGQGGVQSFRGGGGGPIAVQTYGSLGYASMGDGSMDMAVRGARFGTPPPGWGGQAGVAQSPHPTRGGRGGGGPIAPQTYGSLGYASMGDGSMDMAVRQGGRGYRGEQPFAYIIQAHDRPAAEPARGHRVRQGGRSRGYSAPWDCAENCWKSSDVLHPGDFGAYQRCLDACKEKWGSFSSKPTFPTQPSVAPTAGRITSRPKRRKPKRTRRRRGRR